MREALRQLAAFEQLFWLLDQCHPVHFAMTAHVSGRTAIDDWRHALDRLQERHPLLSASIMGEPGAAAWFCQADAARIPLRVVHADPRAQWETEVGKELATPIPPDTAPLVRAVLVHAPDKASLTLAAHHALADGISLSYALRDTLQAVAGARIEPLPDLRSLDDVLWEGGAPPPRNATDADPSQSVTSRPGTYRQRDDTSPQVSGVALPEVFVMQLRDRARCEQASVHAALCAALLLTGRSKSDEWRNAPVRLFSPINLRRVLGLNEQLGLFVSAALSELDLDGASFWDLARRVRADVAEGQRQEKIEALAADVHEFIGTGPDLGAAADYGTKVFARDAFLSNVGDLPFPRHFGDLRLDAIWGPCVLQGWVDEQNVGVATVNGVLTISHTSYTPMPGLLQGMIDRLGAACATAGHGDKSYL